MWNFTHLKNVFVTFGHFKKFDLLHYEQWLNLIVSIDIIIHYLSFSKNNQWF